VDCELFAPKRACEEQSTDIFFSGNFLYSPNRHAVRFFLKEVFPLVRRALPQATLTVVGNGAGRFMGANGARPGGVRVFDFVPSLRPHLARASVAVAPIRFGAGVSNKLLEAFAVGTPIVSTTMACGDLPCRDGEHFFVADDARRFAERVVLLLENPELRRAMAGRAQAFVNTHYNWEIVAGSMEQVLLGAIFHQGKDIEVSTVPVAAKARTMAAAAGQGFSN
jgi:glycosyltransferase involved in cell wall biosynthesis